MIIAKFNKDRHYLTMCRLWELRKWFPCPIEALPKNSLVAETTDGMFIAYLGMYMEPSAVFLIDWALTNPEIDKVIRDEALKTLFKYLVEIAKVNKCPFGYSVTKVESWGKKLQSYGMTLAETGVNTYVMALDNKDKTFIGDY